MGFRSDNATIADRTARALIEINGPRSAGRSNPASGLRRPVESASDRRRTSKQTAPGPLAMVGRTSLGARVVSAATKDGPQA